ncbi:MAG: LytTR family DNA-binding domain-containing protein [Pseudomonadota bacterium]
MEKLNIVIAEDDPAQAEAVALMIKSLRPAWRVVATPASASQTLDVLHRYQPDIALLDIGLADTRSGLDIAKEVARHCPIIFVTGEPSHALAAFDIGAADYLVKPLRLSRLEQALLRTEQILRDSAIRPPTSDAPGETEGAARYLQMTSGRKLIWTAVNEVRYLQAETGYTRFFLKESSGLVRHGIQTVALRLDRRDFWQIHRSVIVNARFVEEIERDDIGRLLIRIQGYPKRLLVAKNQERLFREDFFN